MAKEKKKKDTYKKGDRMSSEVYEKGESGIVITKENGIEIRLDDIKKQP